MAHPDLASEQEHLDHAYACLAAMRRRTEDTVAIEDMAAQAVDGEIARWHLGQRLRSLDVDVPGLAFGRIDEEGTPRRPGPTWYVGRRHVEDQHGEPVVVDWRASVSTPFYRATASDPFGLRRRRRFVMSGQHVDDLFDEDFDDPDSIHAARHGGIPDPLLAELERERTGEMRDIVATIQAEQDVVIRAPLDACLVVQGGPGTGKTAVGLHRAAFLLYEHRQLLDEEGVLVVGPNPVFLRYIAQVLPSLGETAVHQTTVERLLGGRVRAFDTPSVAAVKGDARMAAVLAASAASLIKPPVHDVGIATSWGTARLPASEVGALIEEIRSRGVPHNVGRNALRTQLVRIGEQWIADRRGEDTAPLGFAEQLRTDKVFQRSLGGVVAGVERAVARPEVALVAGDVAVRCRWIVVRSRAGIVAAQADQTGRRRAVDRGRSRARRRGPRDRRRAPSRVRAHRRRRSAGPDRHGAPRAGAPLPSPIDDRARRSRAGDPARLAAVVGRRARASRIADRR